MIYKVAWENNLGLMDQDIKVNIKMGKKMEKGNFIGLMVQFIKDFFLTIIYTDMEFTFGLMVENFKDNGKIIKWMGKVSFLGLMEGFILVNILMIKNTDTDNLFGRMEENIKEHGLMVSRMDKEFISVIPDKLKKDYGNKEIELNGLKIK